MNTQLNEINVKTLETGWTTLTATLRNKSVLDYQLFKELFTQTFELLKECRTGNTIAKVHMKLIINAYNFIGTPNTSIDFMPKAAFVLTERMLNYCLLEEGSKTEKNGVYIYIMEGYQDFYLDFDDIDTSMNKLSLFFDKKYWENINF